MVRGYIGKKGIGGLIVGGFLTLYGLPGILSNGTAWWRWSGGFAAAPYLVTLLGIAVLAITIYVVVKSPSHSSPAATIDGDGDLRITYAMYGLPGKEVDVRQRLNEMIADDVLDFEVLPEVIGTDPASGVPKKLRVRWTYRGEPDGSLYLDTTHVIIPRQAARKPDASSGQSESVAAPDGPNDLQRKNTERLLDDMAEKRRTRERCEKLIEDGYALRAKFADPIGAAMMMATVMRQPAAPWVYDARGFVVARLKRLPEGFPDERTVTQRLEGGSASELRDLIDVHLDALGTIRKRLPLQ